MKNFYQWLKESVETSNVTIDYSTLQKQYQVTVEKYLESIRNRKYKKTIFNPVTYLENIKQVLKDYPLVNNFINALNSKNKEYIFDQSQRLRKWLDGKTYKETEEARKITREIWTWIEFYETDEDHDKAEQEVVEMMHQAMTGTQALMEENKKLINDAISRVENWHGSQVILKPLESRDEDGSNLVPASSAEVILIFKGNKSYFSFFRDKSIFEIDDVLDAGDDDFFVGVEGQSDYFNLINEIKKPGSTSTGKMLTLYTARPTKDRKQYMNSDTIPVNLFLTNSYDHAIGLANDLAGTEERRDVWKVKINDRYLTNTLDGNIKYYQVTSANAKASFKLVDGD